MDQNVQNLNMPYIVFQSWWRHQIKAFSTLLASFAGNSLLTGEFPAQRPMTRSFDVFFDLCLNKKLSKQWWGWWFEMPSPHYDVTVMKKNKEMWMITLQSMDFIYNIIIYKKSKWHCPCYEMKLILKCIYFIWLKQFVILFPKDVIQRCYPYSF